MYRSKYRKYKKKYLELKNTMERSNTFESLFTDQEIKYINTNIKGLLHFTTMDNFKNIIKDGYIKPRLPNPSTFIPVFTNIWFKSDKYPQSIWGSSEKNVCLIIDKDILFDKNAYFYINPYGEYGVYDYDTIPGPNMRRILSSENMEQYINSLTVNDNIKKGLMNLSVQFKYERNTVNNTIDQLEKKINDFHDICFINKIDIKEYLAGVYVSCNYIDEVSKVVPKDLIYVHDVCKNIISY